MRKEQDSDNATDHQEKVPEKASKQSWMRFTRRLPNVNCCCVSSAMATVAFAAILVAFITVTLVHESFGYPWHAQCRIEWVIPTSCEDFRNKIIDQMTKWGESASCPLTSARCPQMPCGQKCLYKFDADASSTVKVVGSHETPVRRYRDSLSFWLSSFRGSCNVEAFSRSDTWYAVLDYGTNYCNLRNLIDGANLSSLSGFQEKTSTSDCTQYDAIDCDRY